MIPMAERSTVGNFGRRMRYCHGISRRSLGIAFIERVAAPLKAGVMKHVIASPFGVFGILMEVNHEQRQGRLERMIGTSGNAGAYATLNIMK